MREFHRHTANLSRAMPGEIRPKLGRSRGWLAGSFLSSMLAATAALAALAPVAQSDRPSTAHHDAAIDVAGPPPPVADLSIDKRLTQGFPRVGNQLTYVLTVRNDGPDYAPDVTVTDTLSDSADVVSVGPSQGTCDEGPPIQCDLGQIDAGDEATITVVVTPQATGLLTNTATVTGAVDDPDPDNNQDQVSANVNVQRTRVTIHKSASRFKVNPGEDFSWRLIVRNPGPAIAYDVRVCDKLPPPLIFVSAVGATYERESHKVCFERDQLAVGERITLRVHVRLESGLRRRIIRNIAIVRGSNFDRAGDVADVNCTGRTFT